MLKKVASCVIEELLPAGYWTLESNKDLYERIHNDLKQRLKALSQDVDSNKTVMVVTHSGVIHALLSEIDESND